MAETFDESLLLQKRALTVDLLKTLVVANAARTGGALTIDGMIALVKTAKAAVEEL